MNTKQKKLLSLLTIFALYIALVAAIWWELERINQAVIEEQVLNSAVNIWPSTTIVRFGTL